MLFAQALELALDRQAFWSRQRLPGAVAGAAIFLFSVIMEGWPVALPDLAATVGIAPEDASRLFDELKNSEPEMRAKLDRLRQGMTGSPEEIDRQMQWATKAEFEKIAVEILGDQGGALVELIAARELH